MVEQTCPYLDPDAIDPTAEHLSLRSGSASGGTQLLGYARWFEDPDAPGALRLGRVVVHPDARGRGFGRLIVREVQKRTAGRTLHAHAQSYLEAFYTDLGFSVTGPEFLEDDIPHLPMTYAKG